MAHFFRSMNSSTMCEVTSDLISWGYLVLIFRSFRTVASSRSLQVTTTAEKVRNLDGNVLDTSKTNCLCHPQRAPLKQQERERPLLKEWVPPCRLFQLLVRLLYLVWKGSYFIRCVDLSHHLEPDASDLCEVGTSLLVTNDSL